ncbi:MAG: ATP-dependent helicase [Candidatus Marsarchaeota archaeon]|nr:ATP-dependent helicase [Candidatus Marsarchaeota archaeon]MCL5094901.1 ATP-dependent helicase [Candidatus Marsarchaeota archaeon]
MFEYYDKPFSDEENLSVLNKYVRQWFTENFHELTLPQKFAFKIIAENKNIIITAPTGSGKTISGFLSIINTLFNYSLENRLENKIYCIYVSPLRALNNDIYKNLTVPLQQIYDLIIKEKGINIIKENIQKVTIGIRTGDTEQSERTKQLKKPPNILVTTPESLSIMLSSQKFSENFKSVQFIIIDEVHELANNKRGIHLALSVERLAQIAEKKLVRIGMSATLYPLEEAAKFLVGYENNKPRACVIIDASWSKIFEIKLMTPVPDLIYSNDALIENETYKILDSVIKHNKTTLIFTNTRSNTERVIFNLKKRFNYDLDIAAHHGSLSRESRLNVEEMLKKGSLKCVVSSTSLELGVDIGTINNVVQLGSPKSVTRLIQRVGRSGHSFKDTARGEVIVLDRDDLVECAVMIHSAKSKNLDAFKVPQNPLDVLAQHILGMSLTRQWNIDEAYNLVRNAYPYHELEKQDFISLLDYLAGNYVELESRRVYGKIWLDKANNTFARRGNAKLIFMLNQGTIPDEALINVFAGRKHIGSVQEEFFERLKPNDIFALGGHLYKFESSSGINCYVSLADTAAPTIPPWFSEQLPLSYELAMSINKLRGQMFGAILEDSSEIGMNIKKIKQSKKINKILSDLNLDKTSENTVFNYFMEQFLFTKIIPNDKIMLIEQTFDAAEEINYIIFHSLYGRRINDALSRLFAIELGNRFNIDIGIMINDNGFILKPSQKIDFTNKTVSNIINALSSQNIEELLKENLKRTELLKNRFRHVAVRSFMILKKYKNYKITVNKQQINSRVLLKVAEEIDPNFPIIKETYREIFNEVMDLKKAKEIINKIKAKEIECRLVSTPVPSPFAHNIISFGYEDILVMKQKREYLRHLHKLVLEKIEGK